MVVLVLVGASGWAGVRWPRPVGAVADYAHVIPQAYKQRMEALARSLLKATGVAVVVATVPSLEGQSIEQFAADLFEAWGIGKKGEDKGVLILVAVAERKLRIEVGYGLEGIITDARAGMIRDQAIVPWLKKGDYGRGLLKGMEAIASVVASAYGVSLQGLPTRRGGKLVRRGLGAGGLLLFMLVLLWLAMGMRGRRGGGGFISGMIIGSMMGWGGGGGRSGGGFDPFGGGFGGFGGGMSGGGGASGSF